MLDHVVFEGRRRLFKPLSDAVSAAADEATDWMNEREGRIRILHIATSNDHGVATVIVWFEDMVGSAVAD